MKKVGVEEEQRLTMVEVEVVVTLELFVHAFLGFVMMGAEVYPHALLFAEGLAEAAMEEFDTCTNSLARAGVCVLSAVCAEGYVSLVGCALLDLETVPLATSDPLEWDPPEVSYLLCGFVDIEVLAVAISEFLEVVLLLLLVVVVLYLVFSFVVL